MQSNCMINKTIYIYNEKTKYGMKFLDIVGIRNGQLVLKKWLTSIKAHVNGEFDEFVSFQTKLFLL